MKIFGKDHSEDIQYLEEERLKIWSRITEIEELVKEKPSDIEKEAKQALKKASEYRNRAKDAKETAESQAIEILAIKNEIIKVKELLESSKTSLDSQIKKAENSANTLKDLESTTNLRVDTIENKILRLESILAEHPNLESETASLDDAIEKINQDGIRVNAILKNASSRKDEIDEIYYEIVGDEVEDEETGEIERTEGLRDSLENQYKELEENIKKKGKEISSIQEVSEENFDTFMEEKNEDAEKYLNDWRKKYEEYEKTIESLLPKALTAGLSSAFSKKKEDEIKSFKGLKSQFIGGIIGLVIVSLIPFIISYIFLIDNISWDVVIDRVPRLVIAILPLYLPVLWLTYSANKKMNLSKRLIEEYSHKEVLSRTFEGLSNQIENLENSDISNELRIKLLYNFLSVSAENPGKLISNYQSSDHPVMDVLEKSYKLENAIEKLGKIPGFNKVAKVANKRTNSNLEEKAKKIKKGIDAVADIAEDQIE